MITCKICNEEFTQRCRGQRELYMRHFKRFHQKPMLNKDGTIQINACHQIELILRNDETWEQRKQEQRKNDKRFKRVDHSAWLAIVQLEQFEKEHDIEFGYTKSDEFFMTTKEGSC